MVHRLLRNLWLPLLATVFLTSVGLAFQPTDEAKKKAQPQLQPSDPVADSKIETAFGADSEELRRPIRVWVPDIGMVVAAKEVSIASQGRLVRFKSARIGLFNNSVDSNDLNVREGKEVVLALETPIAKLSELGKQRVLTVEVHEKNSIVVIVSQDVPVTLLPSISPPPLPIAPPSATPSSIPANQSFVPSVTSSPESKVVPKEEKEPEIRQRPVAIRFKLKIGPDTPVAALLPTAPKLSSKLLAWTNEDLTKVPEIAIGEPLAKNLTKLKVVEKTSHVVAKINHLNLKATDGFMEAMIAQRTDLRGMPFRMGAECRTSEEQAKTFHQVSSTLGVSIRTTKVESIVDMAAFFGGTVQRLKDGARLDNERVDRAQVAALMQILMPEPGRYRIGLAKYLARIPNVDATKALANLVIFSAEDPVRTAAIEGLRLRREKDYTDILLQGFRYPLPAVSKRAADALVKLDRKDLLEKLVQVLESSDPRLPATEKRDGKDVTFVRELVKVNHHRNCLLCHAPGNTEDTPAAVLKVAVPLPNEPLPKAAEDGYQSTPPSPDMVVRIDMTYLRQDFSLMMPVSNPHPWPQMQRFDFLVRTRTLTPAEAQEYEPCCEADEPGRLSPYHRAALFALRELTGRDTEPTAVAWRKLLRLPATQPQPKRGV